MTDSVYVRDSVYVHDTIIRFRIEADTVMDSIQVHDTVRVAEFVIPVTYKTKTATVKNSFSTATAWIENGFLKIKLMTNDSTFEAAVRQVHREYIRQQKQTKPAAPEKKKTVSPWLYVSGVLFLLVLIIVIVMLWMIKR